jgi:hypothetical protein
MQDLPTNRGQKMWDHHGSWIDIPWIPWQRPPFCPESSKLFKQNHSRPLTIYVYIQNYSELRQHSLEYSYILLTNSKSRFHEITSFAG